MYNAEKILDEMEFESNWFTNVFSSLNPNGIHSTMILKNSRSGTVSSTKNLFCLVNIINELHAFFVTTRVLVDEI